jgi:hypothetical protein
MIEYLKANYPYLFAALWIAADIYLVFAFHRINTFRPVDGPEGEG